MNWKNRIVGYSVEEPDKFQEHPQNPRVHPPKQQELLTETLGKLGWLAPIIVNKRTNRVLDGHLRLRLARQRQTKVPVIWVDLDEEEEALFLATFDVVTALAYIQKEVFDDLLELAQAQLESLEGIEDLLKQMGILQEGYQPEGLEWSDFLPPEEEFLGKRRIWEVVVECPDEEEAMRVQEALRRVAPDLTVDVRVKTVVEEAHA